MFEAAALNSNVLAGIGVTLDKLEKEKARIQKNDEAFRREQAEAPAKTAALKRAEEEAKAQKEAQERAQQEAQRKALIANRDAHRYGFQSSV